VPQRDARILTYQASEEGDILTARAYPVTRAALARIFRDHLLGRKVFVRAAGRPARAYARLLEGLGYRPSLARTLVVLDGEEFLKIAAHFEDRYERAATFEFCDASLRAKKKDANPHEELPAALGAEIDAVIFRDAYLRFKTRLAERRAALFTGLIERFLRANAAPPLGPLPEGIIGRIEELSRAVGLSLAPESIALSEDAVTIALWRGRIRSTGVEMPPFLSQANERADLRFDRRSRTWQLSENFRPAPCPLGPFGYSRDFLLAGLWFDDPARRKEAFERLAAAGAGDEASRADDLAAYVRALAAERDPEVRAAGVAHLLDFGEEAARETLVAALEDEEEVVRTAAARALAGARALAADPRVRPRVEQLLIRTESVEAAEALLALYARVPPGGRIAFLRDLAPLKPTRLLAPIVEVAGAVGAAPGEDRAAALAFMRAQENSRREVVREAVKAARRAMRKRKAEEEMRSE
jgi:hypothetical protein